MPCMARHPADGSSDWQLNCGSPSAVAYQVPHSATSATARTRSERGCFSGGNTGLFDCDDWPPNLSAEPHPTLSRMHMTQTSSDLSLGDARDGRFQLFRALQAQ